MSLGFDDVNSEARKTQQARDKVRVTLWPDQAEGKTKTKLTCMLCRVKLEFRENGTKLWCKECGKTINIEDRRREQKLTSKFPNAAGGGSVIVSKKANKRVSFVSSDAVNQQLTDEDVQDLRAAGIIL